MTRQSICSTRSARPLRARSWGCFGLALIALVCSTSLAAQTITVSDDDGDGWLWVCSGSTKPNCQTTDNGTITVPQTAVYEITLKAVSFDSGDAQYNESFFLLIKNSDNPNGFPQEGNCNADGKRYQIVYDRNPGNNICENPPQPTLQKVTVGRFLLKKGVNQVEMLHACAHAPAACKAQFDKPGPCNTPCATSAQSVGVQFVATKVEAPCVPSAEVCDGIDNDCDGVVDNNLTDVGGSCTVGVGECKRTGQWICGAGGLVCSATPGTPTLEVCDGKDNDCDGKIDEDIVERCANACGVGTTVCTNGTWSQCSAPTPQPEVCDGVDNNCDGQIDENLTKSCSTACGTGTKVCTAGKWGSCSAPTPEPEVCDGIDNNCDGKIDENLTKPCSNACGTGTKVCTNGKWGSCSVTTPTPEVCDGIDNNCDGKIDENLTKPCSTKCGTGTMVCTNGKWGSCSTRTPEPEVCDGIDNNCDGQIDENLTKPCSNSCGTGTMVCTNGKWGSCSAPTPQPEVCDGIDNNCDGQIDENLTEVCATQCGSGVRVCKDGSWGECTAPKPETEVCDGRDNDCDGTVDNDTTCDDNGLCICGGCTRPCVNGECAEGSCVDGQCVVDRCPDGLRCDLAFGRCVDPSDDGTTKPDDPNDDGNDPGNDSTKPSDDGHNQTGATDPLGTGTTDNSSNAKTGGACQQGSGGSSSLPLALLIVLCLLFARRSRRRAVGTNAL